MAREGFGTDPSGRLAQGAPSSGGGRGMSVGVGGGTSIGPGWKNGPMIVLKKKYKSGGKVEGKCDPQVAAFKNMIKNSAKPVKKALGGGMDAKLSRSITNAKADMARMAATPRVDPRNIKETPGGGMFGKMMKNPDMRAKLEAAAEKVGVPAQRIGIGYPVRSTPVPKIQYKGSEMPVKRAVGGAGKTRKGMTKGK